MMFVFPFFFWGGAVLAILSRAFHWTTRCIFHLHLAGAKVAHAEAPEAGSSGGG